MSTTSASNLLTQLELAAQLGKSEAWCERARWAGTGPKFIKIGRSVRYRQNDVDEWFASQVRSSTRDDGTAEKC